MARLTSLRPALRTLDTRTARPAQTVGSGWQGQTGSSASRGYGADWRKVRAVVLAEEPLCRFCAEAGRVTPASHVDHIEPFHGLHDPLRLDRRNLRPLCEPCHMRRTQRQTTGAEG